MGVQISDIIPKKEIAISELHGKVVAIDAFNTLYQFLTTIRQVDGTPLMNSKGEVTSHLSGLFYRNISLLQDGIKPVYVFDGEAPEMKKAEVERRREEKRIAEGKYEKAKAIGDEEGMKKYSGRFVKLTDKIIEESKELLEAMGIPVVQAPGEGEAEAAVLAREGKVWAAASQDYDALLYGVPYLIRNLTLARKRKTSAGIYVDVNPELIDFQQVLNKLQIDKDQLICLAILVGTDYNPGGVKGLGQKKALEIVQKYKYPVEIFGYVEKSHNYFMDFDWQEIFKHFHEYRADFDGDFEFGEVDEEKVKEILMRNDFSEARIDSGLKKMSEVEEEKKQKGLGEFF